MKKLIISILLMAAIVSVVALVARGQAPKPGVPSDKSGAVAVAPPSGMLLAGIKTSVASYAPVHRTIHMTGQVVLTETGRADITTPLTGVIVEPLVKVGDNITAGTPVAVVNSVYGQTGLQILQKLEQDQTAVVSAQSTLGTSESTLTQAQSSLGQAQTALSQSIDNVSQGSAELSNARIDLRRKKKLFEGGVNPKSDVDDAQERYLKAQAVDKDARNSLAFARHLVDVARSNLSPLQENIRLSRQAVALGQANLERDRSIFNQSQLSGANLPKNLTPINSGPGRYSAAEAAGSTSFHLRAPFSGTVTSVAMSAGLAVSPGTIVASMVNTREVYVDGNAFDSDLPFVHVGDAVSVSVASYPNMKFSGHVRYIGKAVDPASRTVPVRSLVANPSDVLRTQMFASVKLESRAQGQVLVVPDNAVLIHGDNRYVFVETEPGKYEKRKVVVGISSEGQSQIQQGLKSGDRVVTDGNLLLEEQD